MLNFTQFVLLIVGALLLMIMVFFLTGITYNRLGFVSVIEKHKKFYKVEDRKLSYYLPLLYKKAKYYPIAMVKSYKVNHTHIFVKVKNPKLLYEKKIKLNKLVKNKNLAEVAKLYQLEYKIYQY